MEEYVSLQAVLDIVMQYCPDDDGSCSKADVDYREMLDEIEALPTTDVQLEKELKDLIEENKLLMQECDKLGEAKELLKLATDTINHNSHKSCYTCSHFTSDCNCDIGKYLYGTGEKECEWEWKHMGEIINFLHD